MSVCKYRAFIFLDQPPPWVSRTHPTVLLSVHLYFHICDHVHVHVLSMSCPCLVHVWHLHFSTVNFYYLCVFQLCFQGLFSVPIYVINLLHCFYLSERTLGDTSCLASPFPGMLSVFLKNIFFTCMLEKRIFSYYMYYVNGSHQICVELLYKNVKCTRSLIKSAWEN